MGFLGIRIGEGINRCKRKCESWYPGAPDLVAGCKSACKQEPRGLTKCKYLENYVGDQTSISKYGIDCDTSKGIGSELVKQQQKEKEMLLQMQKYVSASNQYQQQLQAQSKRTLLTIESLKLAQKTEADAKAQQQMNLLLFAALAVGAYFFTTKIILKNG